MGIERTYPEKCFQATRLDLEESCDVLRGVRWCSAKSSTPGLQRQAESLAACFGTKAQLWGMLRFDDSLKSFGEVGRD